MPKYIVLGYVRNQGETKGPGQIIELSPKEAAPLLKLKTISPAPKEEKKKEADPGKKEPDKEPNSDPENTK